MLQIEERPVAAPVTAHSVSSCTPHRRRARYHIRYDDFIQICADDTANADALRVFENKTNQRVAWLRREHDIPATHLPHEDDLWIDMSLRDLEALTLRAWGKSRFALCLLEQTREGEPKSLLELSLLRRRFVARSCGGPSMKPATTVYIDERGEPFIVVDTQGMYVDSEGAEHSAVSEGYSLITRQYLYEIQVINTAIAELDEEPPPKPMPRWKSVIQRRGTKKRRTGIEDDESQGCQNATEEDNSMLISVQGGTKKPVDDIVSSGYQDNTRGGNMSRTREHCVNNVSLCTAQWTPETLIALSGQPDLLDVPDDPAQCDDWQRDWAEPAQFLIGLPELQGIEPRRAWECIERHIRGMISGPTWYATKRDRFTPFALRHVVSNWRVVAGELNRASPKWYPEQTTPYDGPPLLDVEAGPGGYAQGYVEVSEVRGDEGCEVAAQPVPPGSGAVEQPRQPMKPRAADRLALLIGREYPTINVGIRDTDVGSFVGIEYGEGQWFDFGSVVEWHRMSPEAESALVLALQFAESRARSSPIEQEVEVEGESL